VVESVVNYLAHAYQHLHRPYFMAGTALPDWMNVIDRKNRARRHRAQPVTGHMDPEIAEFALGVVQHHEDDQWFHTSESFIHLSSRFAAELKGLLGADLGHQAAFVGHISVELLLDAELITRNERLLDGYYNNLAQLNAAKLVAAAGLICPSPVPELALLVPRFIDERFLADYTSDQGLCRRLNGVMRRVNLPPLPQSVIDWLAVSRRCVADRTDDLLAFPQRQA
jgi:hypothetical protein